MLKFSAKCAKLILSEMLALLASFMLRNIVINGEKFWTRTRSKYTDLGEFEAIWLYKTIRL